MSFSEFKNELLALFVNGHYFDDDMLKSYFKDYELMSEIPTMGTVKEFANFYFKSWKPETHNAWLKRGKEKRDYMAELRERSAKKAASRPKRISEIKIRPYSLKMQRIKTDEAKAMREFWDEHADYRGWCRCMETGQWLRGYDAYYVHHVHTKGAHCPSRLDKENFVIVSYDVHNIIHTEGEKELKLYPYFLEVREKMKIKYSKKKSA